MLLITPLPWRWHLPLHRHLLLIHWLHRHHGLRRLLHRCSKRHLLLGHRRLLRRILLLLLALPTIHIARSQSLSSHLAWQRRFVVLFVRSAHSVVACCHKLMSRSRSRAVVTLMVDVAPVGVAVPPILISFDRMHGVGLGLPHLLLHGVPVGGRLAPLASSVARLLAILAASSGSSSPTSASLILSISLLIVFYNSGQGWIENHRFREIVTVPQMP